MSSAPRGPAGRRTGDALASWIIANALFAVVVPFLVLIIVRTIDGGSISIRFLFGGGEPFLLGVAILGAGVACLTEVDTSGALPRLFVGVVVAAAILAAVAWSAVTTLKFANEDYDIELVSWFGIGALSFAALLSVLCTVVRIRLDPVGSGAPRPAN